MSNNSKVFEQVQNLLVESDLDHDDILWVITGILDRLCDFVGERDIGATDVAQIREHILIAMGELQEAQTIGELQKQKAAK